LRDGPGDFDSEGDALQIPS